MPAASCYYVAMLVLRCLFLFLFWPCFSFATATAYRVIHASPQEVVSALFLPATPAQLRLAKARHPQESRLQKYFRLKSKTIRDQQVTLELLPTIPVIEDYLPSTQPITIVLKKTSQRENTYNFDSHFELFQGRFFDARIEVSPNESGSLIFLQLQQANVPDKIVKLFFYTAEQLGFIAESKESAVAKDHKEK